MLETRPTFTISDFVVAIVGGLVGALLGAFSLFLSSEPGVVLIVTLTGQYAGHLLAVSWVLRRKGAKLTDLGFEVLPRDGLYVLFGIGLQVAVALLFSPLATLLDAEGSQQAITELLPTAEGSLLQALLVVTVALVAPVTEELMFRGVLLRAIEGRRGPRRALFSTALLFALFHLLGIGGDNALVAAAILIPQLFLVGLILARQAQRYGRLGPAIFTHAGFNLIAVITLLVMPELGL